MSEITADELLRRICAARGAAADKATEFKAASEVGEPDTVSVGLAMQAQTYRAVVEVLDLIIEPSE
ncbi:hypothetical protein AB0I98_16780 [Streptomyces sp. NPDC050211]|uniref:hypothetical protein n=1 Tax=Streptomyces sp. NPDC050211 TaxID=3154932 RepID=UPI00342039B7